MWNPRVIIFHQSYVNLIVPPPPNFRGGHSHGFGDRERPKAVCNLAAPAVRLIPPTLSVGHKILPRTSQNFQNQFAGKDRRPRYVGVCVCVCLRAHAPRLRLTRARACVVSSPANRFSIKI